MTARCSSGISRAALRSGIRSQAIQVRNLTRIEWEDFGPRDQEYRATCEQYPIEGETAALS